MAFELPDLPYAYDALGPYMSKETLEYHHDKHHQAYVTNGNKLLEGSGLEGKSLEDICRESFGKNAGLFNNAGQHFNHLLFGDRPLRQPCGREPSPGGGAFQAPPPSLSAGCPRFRHSTAPGRRSSRPPALPVPLAGACNDG